MKAKFNPTERCIGIMILRKFYNLPRNKMVSGAELQAEIDNLARRNAKGSLYGTTDEELFHRMNEAGLMRFASLPARNP